MLGRRSCQAAALVTLRDLIRVILEEIERLKLPTPMPG